LGIVFVDHGPGLPEDVRRLRRRQVDGAGAGAGVTGHGLGLWIVRRAVMRLGGLLKITNRPGTGVTFDIDLPWADAPETLFGRQ
jgi:signal transduction histidine kinase